MDAPAVASANLPKAEQERLAVVVALENRLPSVPACHHMINGSGILVAQRSWHSPSDITG